jgi:hypothetical protein
MQPRKEKKVPRLILHTAVNPKNPVNIIVFSMVGPFGVEQDSCCLQHTRFCVPYCDRAPTFSKIYRPVPATPCAQLYSLANTPATSPPPPYPAFGLINEGAIGQTR